MEEQFDFYIEEIREFIDEEIWFEASEKLDSIFYKRNKSIYHYENIKKIIDNINLLSEEKNENNNDFEAIYYEMESFLITVRSSVDILMHFINAALQLDIKNKDVYLATIYQNHRLPNRVKNVLHQFSHNRDNEIWEFIYLTRNEIIHSISLKEKFPVEINNFDLDTIVAKIEIKNKEKNLVNFFMSCLKFIDRFISKILESVLYTLKNTN